MRPLPSADLAHILDHTTGVWNEFDGKRIFITGGTGFFGKWILESLLAARNRHGLDVSATVLTRNPDKFRATNPEVTENPAINLLAGDIRSFSFPKGKFSHVLHAATDADTRLIREKPELIRDSIVHGTRRTLDFATHAGVEKFLMVSSGAVYGTQPPGLSAVPEDHPPRFNLDDPNSVYGRGKRVAELLVLETPSLQGTIARCFAFVGPHLPLDAHYAIGNFIRDARSGGPLEIRGDGTPFRSYLYAADLAIWLWTILTRGKQGSIYNVGNPDARPLREIAEIVSKSWEPHPAIHIQLPPSPTSLPSRYVPDVTRAETELGLRTWIGLPDAVARTKTWLGDVPIRSL